MRVGLALISILVLPGFSYAEETTASGAAGALPVIDCHYQFSKDLKNIEPSIVETWARHAAVQLFTFNNAELTKQLETLKLCFTDQGWQGFHAAFQKSGNLDAIKSRELEVSSAIKGKVSIETVKENQWKVSLPMDILYQNKENKIDQSLTVNLLITRKPSGGLGILQVIAAPQQKETPPQDSIPASSH